MKENVQQTLSDTLEYLMTLVHESARPEQAKASLRPLQKRHSDVGFRLVWEEESYDQSIHYDALLNLPGRGTVSLSYCDDRAKPWPLRGIQRWSESDLVRVNGNVLTVDRAIACLDFIWDEARITDGLVNACLLQEELETNPIEISDQELQQAMDSFRRLRKLHKAEDTLRWMDRHGMSHAELERLVENQATIARLRDRLVAGSVEEYFDAHSTDFDTAYTAQFSIADEQTALETFQRIRRGETEFFDEAQRHFLAKKQSEKPLDLFSVLQRRETPEELRTSLYECMAGSTFGPVRGEQGYTIIRVLSLVRGNLNEATRKDIKSILFDRWLEERRRVAAIEWYWGNASQTSQNVRTDNATLSESK